jgi:hypothetical protein
MSVARVEIEVLQFEISPLSFAKEVVVTFLLSVARSCSVC